MTPADEVKTPDAAPPPNPLDPLGVATATMDVMKAMFARPESFLQAQVELANAWVSLAGRPAAAAPEKPRPIIEPLPGDSRWKHAAWTDNATFEAIKEAYLLAAKAAMDAIEGAEGVDAETKARVKFFAKLFCDAMSPTNFAFLNPAVIEETARTGGQNLERGYQNILADMRENNGRPALVDKSAFEVGKNVATSSGSVVFRNELIELIQYRPTTETVLEKPLVIVPPWINKYYILDLQPKNSLIKFAVDSGVTTFVISWRNPNPSMSDLSMEDYLELGPLAASRVASAITGSPDVNLIGYCIGGTLVSMMLAYLAKTREILVNSVTFFAALTDFSNAGDLRVFLGSDAVAFIEEQMREQGVLQGSQMADTFNMLRANDLVWNVAVNRYLLGKDAPAFDLLYWNSDATRLPRAMHSYYLRNMYLENNLIKPGALQVNGVPIDLRKIRNDVYSVATMDDHIAPWRAVYGMTQLFSGKSRFVLGHSGHIAGIINSPATGKGHWWASGANPPSADDWLATAEKHPGSWWTDWIAWLEARSGSRIAAPAHLGAKQFAPLAAAPGSYVLER